MYHISSGKQKWVETNIVNTNRLEIWISIIDKWAAIYCLFPSPEQSHTSVPFVVSIKHGKDMHIKQPKKENARVNKHKHNK